MPRVPTILLILLVSLKAAVASDIEAHLYPAKTEYLIGEAIFIHLNLVNRELDPVQIEGFPTTWPCAPSIYDIHVNNAERKRKMRSCFGFTPPSCHHPPIVLQPGQNHSERLLLNEWWLLESPGPYTIEVSRTLVGGSIRQGEDAVTIESSFEIYLREGSQFELESVFAPLVYDLYGPDPDRAHWALLAISETAPSFLESTILELTQLAQSENIFSVFRMIAALAQLDTPQSRLMLGELAESCPKRLCRRDAIRALGQISDRQFLALLVTILIEPGPIHLKGGAFRSIGSLGGEEAIPFLVSQLSQFDRNHPELAVLGLANTRSPEAVPVLIDLLDSSDLDLRTKAMRTTAMMALRQLTHRQLGDEQTSTPSERKMRWLTWWKQEGRRAQVCGPLDCGPFKTLE